MPETTPETEISTMAADQVERLVGCGDCGEVIKEGDYGIEFCEDCMFDFQSQDLEDQLEALL